MKSEKLTEVLDLLLAEEINFKIEFQSAYIVEIDAFAADSIIIFDCELWFLRNIETNKTIGCNLNKIVSFIKNINQQQF